MYAVGPVPQFPSAAAALLQQSPPPDLADAFLEDVTDWRSQALAWLGLGDRSRYVSDRLAHVLAWTLGALPSSPFRVTAYRLDPFPTHSVDRRRHVLDVLVWRSRVVDFLSDAWDVLGPDAFGPEECATLEEWFVPRGTNLKTTCIDCLQPVKTDSRSATPHRDECPILQERRVQDIRAGAPWTKSPWDEPR